MKERDFTAHARRLGWAWLALLALMLASLGSSYVPMGAGNAAAGIGIAIVKSTLVVWLFMRIGSASASVRVGDVDRDHQRLAAEALHVGARAFQAVVSARQQRDAPAVAREFAGDRAADAGRGAGDGDDRALGGWRGQSIHRDRSFSSSGRSCSGCCTDACGALRVA